MESSPPADDRLIGRILADRYRILELLGEGGMGRVYLAEQLRIARRAAVKVISPDMARSPDAIARFNREAANAARINHPNVAQIYDFGETAEGVLYLAMEFIEGDTLRTIIQRRGPMAPARAAALTKQIAEALEAAHHLGLVHRDLKPDNIMVAHHHDGSDWVKVVDFGIAKTVQGDGERGSQTLTTAGVSLGTPEYMSPEQLAGERLDNRTDLYSLGLVLFNMLTAKLPYPELTSRETLVSRLTAKPLRLIEVAPGIAWPPALQATLDRALAPEAAHRYPTVTEFALDVTLAAASFDPYATRRAASASNIGATVRLETLTTPEPRKRRRWLAPLIVTAAAVVLVAAGSLPYTQQKFPYAVQLATAGMTRARSVADAAYEFYRFYHDPPVHHPALRVADTAIVDTAAADTPSAATRSVAMSGGAPSGVAAVLQGVATPEPTRDSQPQFITHPWLRANGDSGAAEPLPANATIGERIRRLGDELRGHAIRANQFMARGDVAHMRSEVHDLTDEAQVLRVLYPNAADNLDLDELLRAAHSQLYDTCLKAAADSTLTLPPNFACLQLWPNGSNGIRAGGDGTRPPL